MTTVYIGGSRTVSRLNPPLRQRLEHMVKCGARFLIGDANGADKAVQQFLASLEYRNVEVYCAQECLNNLGGWPSRQVGLPKERGLIADARCAVMLWDGKSPDTLHTLRELLAAHKQTLLYFSPTKSFHNLASESELDEFLAQRA